MNSTPGSEQHDHKRHKHHGIVLAAAVVALGIIVAGIYAFSSRDSQARPAPAKTATGPDTGLPERLAFSARGTPSASGPPAATTSSPAPRPQATSTPKPKATPAADDAGERPGALEALSVLDAYKFAVHYEATGSIAADYYKQLRDRMTDRPELLPKYTASPDKLLTLDYTGAYVYPDGLYTQWKVGTLRYEEWQVGTNGATHYNDEAVEKVTTTRFSIGNNAAHRFWSNQLLGWFEDEAADLRCRASSEKVNGQKVRQCTVSNANKDQIFDLLDRFNGKSVDTFDEANLVIWLMADENVPVRVSIKFGGKDASGKATRIATTMDLTEINSSAIKVSLPK